MTQNKNIVDRVNRQFLERMREEAKCESIADKIDLLITSHDKPKADQFIQLYRSENSRGDAAE